MYDFIMALLNREAAHKPQLATIQPVAPTPLDIALQCRPLAVQREDTAFRLTYMAEIMDGIDLLA